MEITSCGASEFLDLMSLSLPPTKEIPLPVPLAIFLSYPHFEGFCLQPLEDSLRVKGTRVRKARGDFLLAIEASCRGKDRSSLLRGDWEQTVPRRSKSTSGNELCERTAVPQLLELTLTSREWGSYGGKPITNDTQERTSCPSRGKQGGGVGEAYHLRKLAVFH